MLFCITEVNLVESLEQGLKHKILNELCMYYYNFVIITIITAEFFTRRVYKGNTFPTAVSRIISFFL